MKIAVIQLETKDSKLHENLKQASSIIQLNDGFDLYLLPELWTTGYGFKNNICNVPEELEITLDYLNKLSKQINSYIAGSFISKNSQGYLVNRFHLFSPSGDLALFYDKIHLFRGFEEQKYLKRGDSLPPQLKIKDFIISPLICYDLRFPEIFRKLVYQGTNVFLISSAWPESRIHIMNVLSEARAIENQCYLINSNRVGRDNDGLVYGGNSAIYGPQGIIKKADSSQIIINSNLKLKLIQESRNSFISFKDYIDLNS
jgi:predicted amidohydrolase